MSDADAVDGGDGSSRSWLGLARRVLQVALLGLVGYGLVSSTGGLAANAALAFAVALLPDLLERRYDHAVDPRLALWIVVAAVVHAAGFLGPYGAESGLLSWYDKVAHVISAGFVAGIGYALVEALDRSSDRVRFPDSFRAAFTLAVVLAVGVVWEVGEFAAGALTTTLTGTEILVQYGVADVVGDIAFNALAAVLVAVYASGYFDGVARAVAGRISGAREA